MEVVIHMTNTNNRVYDDSSITQLKGADRVRLRPGVMLGSSDVRGALHTVFEIFGNSADEAREGFGDKIVVVYHADGSVSVRDFGRGVPMGWNKKEQAWNWHLIFNELYAGGKYNELNGEMDVNKLDPMDLKHYTIGLNGLGSAATQYSSEWTKVISMREDGIYTKEFAKGNPVGDEILIEENTTGETGTYVHWKPDLDVFSDIKFSHAMFHTYLESQAYINELTVEFVDEVNNNSELVTYNGTGIIDYLTQRVGEDNIVDLFVKQKGTRGYEKGKGYLARTDIVLAITTDLTNSVYMHHHNTGVMKVGVHRQAFEDAVDKFFKNIASINGVKITPYDYNGFISILTSSYSTLTSFANQTKDGVSNYFIYELIYSLVIETLEDAVAMGRESITTLINNVVTAALARKKAKEIEAQARIVSKATSTRTKEPEKFIGCTETDPKKREIFITEGDSAKTSCKEARDGRFQALLPIRGKIINGLKAQLDDLIGGGKDKDGKPKKGNQEVLDIISILGTGIDLEVDGDNLFDINKLQYDRIIFTTDADVDGHQIRVLLYTVFLRLFPKLLEEGKVFVAESPLFEFTLNDGTREYAYTADEQSEIQERLKREGKGIKRIHRMKGLGEVNADILWETTMNPETRRLVPLTMDTANETVRTVSNMLFGLDPHKERKNFVFSLIESQFEEEAKLQNAVKVEEKIDEDLYAI